MGIHFYKRRLDSMNRSFVRGVRGLTSLLSPSPSLLSLSPSPSLHRGLHITVTPLQELRLAPRLIVLDTQRSFFSSKKEEEVKVEEAGTEVSEAEKALHDRIAELE